MAHNPYTPPASIVADAVASPFPSRPWQMKAALVLMLTVFFVEVINLALNPEDLELDGLQSPELAIVGALMLFFVGLLAALVACIWRAHRWARIVYSALVMLSLIGELRDLPVALELPWGKLALYLLSLTLDSATLVLLFVPATNAWFQAMRAARLAR